MIIVKILAFMAIVLLPVLAAKAYLAGGVEGQEPELPKELQGDNVRLGRSIPQLSQPERILAPTISKLLHLRPPCPDTPTKS